jgi:hypothetical protein
VKSHKRSCKQPPHQQSRSAETREFGRIWRAMMLAPRLEVCEALLRGESVPVDRLDPEWVTRFGTRR